MPEPKAETENGAKPRYETVLNNIRKEAQKIRESNDKLRDFAVQLRITDHPAPATILDETATVIGVAMAHIKDVFREF